ncbi:substrate-binding domain-containing protein [Bradyrhizobium sp. ARR65]|uniref:substrate-binding domain-containing protein n=1 Tax=Bradyrhizobium sp. ARR65 TaxID=1040989 RepID=UPI000463E8C6|nr:substrate-binding domain-containing protein [Bradyrhizobium sp. ARR65]
MRTLNSLRRDVRSRHLGSAAVALVIALTLSAPPSLLAAENDDLKVCSDPNNLPFSNASGAGFENRLAQLVAAELGKHVTYTWWAQRRGFIRNTLNAGQCDVVMGVPVDYELVETTRPYYRASYVFVSRADRKLDLVSIKDPRLEHLKIGVHLIGSDGTNTPPAQALGQQNIVQNVVGYMIYGDYREPDPPARLIEAVEKGDIDIAAAWGPLAGYAAKTSAVPLTVVPIADTEDFEPLRFQFDIAMGVRKGNHALKARLDDIIARNQPEIRALLASYGVPMVQTTARAPETDNR